MLLDQETQGLVQSGYAKVCPLCGTVNVFATCDVDSSTQRIQAVRTEVHTTKYSRLKAVVHCGHCRRRLLNSVIH